MFITLSMLDSSSILTYFRLKRQCNAVQI
jgi:hypothetical protein